MAGTNGGVEFGQNEVVSYIQYYRNRSSYALIKKVVFKFFTADEISSAKNTLWLKCEQLGDKPVHKDSNYRKKEDADLRDILNSFKKIDYN